MAQRKEIYERQLSGSINIGGERVGYTLYEIDARSEIQRSNYIKSNRLSGSLNIYIPGHGQSASGAKALMKTIANLSVSKVLWSIDITPPKNGDNGKANALLGIIREKCVVDENNNKLNHEKLLKIEGISLFGWSHGGGEAMIIAEKAPELIKNMVGICPTGLVQRSWQKLSFNFLLESFRVLFDAIFMNEGNISRIVAIGYDIFSGIMRDLFVTRSIKRIVKDIRWASMKVCGKNYTYDGEVVLLFAERDGVNRWRDSFPSYDSPKKIDDHLDQFRIENFPEVNMLKVAVLPGNHMSAEISPELFITTAFKLLRSNND